MKFLAASISGILAFAFTFIFVAFVIPKLNLRNIFTSDKPLGADTALSIFSLFVAIISFFIGVASLFVAIKQMRDATEGGKKQEEILNASRQALEQMVNHSREQQLALELSVKNSTEELSILSEQWAEQKRVMSLKPELVVNAVFVSGPHPVLKNIIPAGMGSKNYQYVDDYINITFVSDEKLFRAPVLLDKQFFPVVEELYDKLDEQSVNSNVATLGPMGDPNIINGEYIKPGTYYKSRTTHKRILNIELIVRNEGDREALNVKYSIACTNPSIKVKDAEGSIGELAIERYKRTSAKMKTVLTIPDTVTTIPLIIKVSCEGQPERSIPINSVIK